MAQEGEPDALTKALTELTQALAKRQLEDDGQIKWTLLKTLCPRKLI